MSALNLSKSRRSPAKEGARPKRGERREHVEEKRLEMAGTKSSFPWRLTTQSAIRSAQVLNVLTTGSKKSVLARYGQGAQQGHSVPDIWRHQFGVITLFADQIQRLLVELSFIG